MKPERTVRQRLTRLRERYRRQLIRARTDRLPENCVHNSVQSPRTLPYSRSDIETELDLAPRKATTLVVLQPDSPVRLCMYGSDRPDSWNGVVCDSRAVSGSCSLFRPTRSAAEISDEFNSLMADPKYVLERYPDLAALQWVLEERSPRPDSWLTRILRRLFLARVRVPPALPPPSPDGSDLNGLWNDPPQDSRP